MPSNRAGLRLVTSKISVKERSTLFICLLAIPVAAGCVLAVLQSESVLGLMEWSNEAFEGVNAMVTARLEWFRRS
jgi:hypothetical protein